MRQRGIFVGFAPFVGWTNGLSPWFKKKKSEEVLRDAVAKRERKTWEEGFGKEKEMD